METRSQLRELMTLGKEMGLEGSELQQFVERQQAEARQAEEKAAERVAEE